jgi:hypothetical protein
VIRTGMTSFVSVLLASAVMIGLAVPTLAAGSGRPTLKLAPSSVAIGRKAILRASHLQPNQFYTLLVAVPDISPKDIKDRALLATLLHADAKGNANVRIKLPVITHCGKATLYAYAAKSQKLISTVFTLTGCTAKSGATAPPPPPAGGSKKKKP